MLIEASALSMRLAKVQIPVGVQPGQQFATHTPSGAQLAVTVPHGTRSGDVIQVMVPAVPAGGIQLEQAPIQYFTEKTYP